MNDEQFEIIQENIKDTSEAKKGKDIFYQCTICNDIIPSQPNKNLGCKCGNIFIDIDYFRLAIDDYMHFQVIKVAKK
ncbi:MAG: hypothetical protein K6U03_05290 [Firmicutes bacterium]|nr:hypothetical protein [Bacillota bacterium]